MQQQHVGVGFRERQTLMKADKHHEPVGREGRKRQAGGERKAEATLQFVLQLPAPTSTLKRRRSSSRAAEGLRAA